MAFSLIKKIICIQCIKLYLLEKKIKNAIENIYTSVEIK